jgi:8-oxo-dGTP diphosphatase
MPLQTTIRLTTDVALFTLQENELAILLVPCPEAGCWMLPGGAPAADEGLEAAAMRQLAEQAGVIGVYLEQLYTFGNPDRMPGPRSIAIAYYALATHLQLTRCADSRGSWFTISSLPELAYDHAAIIELARNRLRGKLDYSTIAFQFLPRKFTLGDLQQVYEAIRGESLDKRNFRKRILTLGLIKPSGETRSNGRRPAMLYRALHPERVDFIK